MGGNVVLDDLFRVQVETEWAGRKIYFRALSDLDIQARDEYALLQRAKKRKSLRDPESDDHLRYLDWLESATDDDLRQALINNRRGELVRQSLLDVRERVIPMPDDPTDEERVDVLEARDKEEKRVSDARSDMIEKGVKALEASLTDLDHEKLVAKVKSVALEIQAQLAYSRAWNRYTLYAVMFEDPFCQSHYFESPDRAGEVTPEVIGQLLSSYYEELGKIDTMDLKHFLSTVGSLDTSKPSNGSEAPRTVMGETEPTLEA